MLSNSFVYTIHINACVKATALNSLNEKSFPFDQDTCDWDCCGKCVVENVERRNKKNINT